MIFRSPTYVVSSLCGHSIVRILQKVGREKVFLLWGEMDCQKCHNVLLPTKPAYAGASKLNRKALAAG